MRTVHRGTSNDQRRQSNEETTIKAHYFLFFSGREWRIGRSVGDLNQKDNKKKSGKRIFFTRREQEEEERAT
jgi:hypothetical protein